MFHVGNELWSWWWREWRQNDAGSREPEIDETRVVFHTLSTSNSHKQGRSSLPFAAHERNSSFLYKNGAKFFASGWFLCADCNMQIRLIDEPFHWRMTKHLPQIWLNVIFCVSHEVWTTRMVNMNNTFVYSREVNSSGLMTILLNVDEWGWNERRSRLGVTTFNNWPGDKNNAMTSLSFSLRSLPSNSSKTPKK